MHVLSNQRALTQWRAIVRQVPRLAARVSDRLFDEQGPLAGFLIGMMRAQNAPRSASAPTVVEAAELSPAELALMDYAATLLELFRRESGQPIPRLEVEDLDRRTEALMAMVIESSRTGPLLPKSSQPHLFGGVLHVFVSEADSLPEESAAMVPLLLHAVVDALDAVSGSLEDPTAVPVENWTADRIEEALSVQGDPMRSEALEAAGRFRTELAPRLIAAVERVMSPTPDPDSKHDILWIHALFLLAEWREPAAADLASRFFSADTEARYRLPDEFFLDHAPDLMASLLGHEPARLLEIAANPATDSDLRCDAIHALGRLAAWGQLERPVLVEHLRSLARGGIAQEPTDEWNALAGLVMDAGLRELVPDLETPCREEWLEDQFIRWETLQQLADSPDHRWPGFVEYHQSRTDLAELTSWLDEEEEGEASPDLLKAFPLQDAGPLSRMESLDEPAVPFRAPPSVGRNDPCPCGSGRKFKKCCGA